MNKNILYKIKSHNYKRYSQILLYEGYSLHQEKSIWENFVTFLHFLLHLFNPPLH